MLLENEEKPQESSNQVQNILKREKENKEMEQIMKFEDLLSELKEKGKDATSEFRLRNEDIQSKDRTARIPKIKKELKKKDKLVIPTELAIPFNPATGEPDDTYNPACKFRPIKSATTVALMLKELANRSEVTKSAFMHRAGVETWDTTNVSELTKEDIAIFRKYRVPVIYTLPVVNIDIPTMTGNYGRDYTIDVERDPISNALKDPEHEPMVLKANRFFRDLAYEEVADYQKKIDDGILKDTEKVQKDTKSAIFGKNPISDDHPANWLICIDLPLINTYALNTEAGVNYAGMSADEVRGTLGIIRLNKQLKEAISKYQSGEWIKFDRYFDYWEVDMSCPTEGSTPAEIGQGTTYGYPVEELQSSEYYQQINKAIIDYLDDRQDVEKVFLASVRIAPYDEQVERQLVSALSSAIDTDNKWLTKEVIKRHADFLTIVLGEKGDMLLLDCEMDDDSRADGVLDETKAKEEYDLSKMMMDEESVDLDEIDMSITE